MIDTTDNVRGNFSKTIIFLLSPVLSIPFILNGIYNKNKRSVFLFVILVGIISFSYIPSITNDKADYYYLYQDFSTYSFADFREYILLYKVDFIFYFFIYIFALINIPLHFLFLIVTVFTVAIYFKLFLELAKCLPTLKNSLFFIYFLLFLFSLSPPNLLSGVRYFMAISIVLNSFVNYILFKKNFLHCLLLLILAALTHFSTLVFIPVFLLISLKPKSNKFYRSIFLISFLFVLIPRSFLLDQLSNISLFDTLDSKVQSYLGEKDAIENSLLIGNWNNASKIFLNTLWVFILYFYLIITRKKNSPIKNLLLLVLSVCNIFYSAPTIYQRYQILALILFIILLFMDNFKKENNLKTIYTLLIILSLNFFGDVYAMRANLIKSFNDPYLLTFPTLLIKNDIHYKEIQ